MSVAYGRATAAQVQVTARAGVPVLTSPRFSPATAPSSAIDPTLIDPVAAYAAYIPVSHAGDFRLGVNVLVTAIDTLCLGIRAGAFAANGPIDGAVYRNTTGAIVARNAASPAPAVDGIATILFATPCRLNLGELYTTGVTSASKATYVTGSSSAEAIAVAYAPTPGLWYPSGVPRQVYSGDNGVTPGKSDLMPSLANGGDFGHPSLHSLITVALSQTTIVAGSTISPYSPIDVAVTPGATSIVIQVGTTDGGTDLWDSGTLLVQPGVGVRRHVPGGLPASTKIYIQISTTISGATFTASSVSCVTGADSGVDFGPAHYTRVLALVDDVRQQASVGGVPYGGTPLDVICQQYGAAVANCQHYAYVLHGYLRDMRFRSAALLQLAYLNNGLDVHTRVALRDSATGAAAILDPTFDFAAFKGASLAAESDLHAALLAKDWSGLRFVYLGTFGRALVASYYFDPVLLDLENPAGATYIDPAPYLSASLGSSATGAGTYVLSGGTPGAATVVVDGGSPSSLTVDTHGYSQAFTATASVASPSTGVIRRVLPWLFQR